VATAASSFKRLLVPAVLAAAFLAAVPAANADLISGVGNVLLPTCGTNSQPFAQFGDYNSYFAGPNNGLEDGSTGWSMGSGASVGRGNEPWYIGGWGSHSLVLAPGATAYSPATCINLLDPHVRAFARSNGADDALRVQVIFYGLAGNLLGVLNVADQQADDYSSWQPTGDVSSVLAVPLATTSFRVRFTSLAGHGTWQVDDLFVDPWVSRG
jgi:hypothetical protein